MKRFVASICLFVFAAAGAAAWAEACCPPEHEMDMRSSDDCLAAATQVTFSPVASKAFSKEAHPIVAATISAAALHLATHHPPAELPPPGAARPGTSQISPVLLR